MLNLNSQDFMANEEEQDSCSRHKKGKKLFTVLPTAGTATYALS